MHGDADRELADEVAVPILAGVLGSEPPPERIA